MECCIPDEFKRGSVDQQRQKYKKMNKKQCTKNMLRKEQLVREPIVKLEEQLEKIPDSVMHRRQNDPSKAQFTSCKEAFLRTRAKDVMLNAHLSFKRWKQQLMQRERNISQKNRETFMRTCC